MTRKCPKHKSAYPCKACARARRIGAPQKPVASVQPTDEQVRAARANLLPLKRAVDVDAKRDEPMVAADRRAELARRTRQLYASLDQPGTRKKFGVTRRDISNLLSKNPAMAEGLKPHEVRQLIDVGARNISLLVLAHRLNTNLAGLDRYLESLEAKVIGNARARGIALGHALNPSDEEFEGRVERVAASEDAEVDNDTLAKIVEGPHGNEGDNGE